MPAPTPYRLGPGDTVTITGWRSEEISGKVLKVEDDGRVTMRLFGAVAVSGEYASQPVSVMGAVNKPGVYHLGGPDTGRLTKGPLLLPGASLPSPCRLPAVSLPPKTGRQSGERRRDSAARPDCRAAGANGGRWCQEKKPALGARAAQTYKVTVQIFMALDPELPAVRSGSGQSRSDPVFSQP